MGIHFLSVQKALPKKQLTNDMLEKMVDTDDEWIRTRTGIRSRCCCDEGETCVSLACEAADRAIAKAGIDKTEIGALIVATSSQDDALPATACMVQERLGLREEMLAFDISIACTGFLVGLAVAHGLFATLHYRYIVVIGSEKLSGMVDYTDRETCILFGDGAGAAVIEASDNPYWQKCWTRGRRDVLYCPLNNDGQSYISMKGREVFKFAVTVLRLGIKEILKESGQSMDDVDFIVCHQANERIIRHVQKKFPGHEDKFFINIAELGNTSAASIPIALADLFASGRLKPGMKILCVGFGAGLSWNSVLMEW